MMAILKSEILDIGAAVLRSSIDQLSQTTRIDIPQGMHPGEVTIWLVEMYDYVTSDELRAFCGDLKQDSRHLVTAADLKKVT